MKQRLHSNAFELITVINKPYNLESLNSLKCIFKIEEDLSKLLDDHFLNLAIASIEYDNLNYQAKIKEIQEDSKKLAHNFKILQHK